MPRVSSCIKGKKVCLVINLHYNHARHPLDHRFRCCRSYSRASVLSTGRSERRRVSSHPLHPQALTNPASLFFLLFFLFSGCGLLPQCQCEANPATGCELLFDECSQQFYWPSTCGACGACPKVCVICKWSSLSAVRADDGP
jgi:hypothetical protein